ncbi:MAG: hypothetical protein HS115_00100 [Spirochaetales bacterium]|nr:hypothetical protein [Spirochaetales bacterium]
MKIDLVFRTVGERTSQLALELAQKHIQPDTVHLIENVRPFPLAVRRMLEIDYQCDYVVFMDADCIVLEDMRPFLESNSQPFIDCYLLDRFRGRVHCGIHITRLDVVRAMQKIQLPDHDRQLILRPESRLRNLALNQLGLEKTFKSFKILHDFFQYYCDIFSKYALRELKSREGTWKVKFDASLHWSRGDDLDRKVAFAAIESVRRQLGGNPDSESLADYLGRLPETARSEVSSLGITEKNPLTMSEIEETASRSEIQESFRASPQKVFGIGLGRTGTKSLSLALDVLGIIVIHYPISETIYQEMTSGNFQFSILQEFDGITDITVAAFFRELDELYPGSKFVLTVREEAGWLKSMEEHWSNKPIHDHEGGPSETQMKIRRFLRATVYGIYTYSRQRLRNVHRQHEKDVREYFKDKDNLLIMDITRGDGWDRLCPFLGLPVIDAPFPYVNKKDGL